MPIKGALYAVRCRHHHCHCHCHCHWRAALTRRPLGRFDQDGTLLDTETLATEAIRAVIAPYGGMLRRAPLTCPRPVCRDVRVEPQAAPPRAADACVDRHRRRGPRARREAQRRGARRAVGGVPERQGVSCGLARTRTDSHGLARTHARHRCRNASPARWRSCGSSGRPGSRRRSARPRRGRSRRSGASTSVSSSVSRHGARAAPHHPRSELRRGPDGGGRHEGQARPGDLPERRRAPRTRAQRVCRVRGRAPRRPCREGGWVSLSRRCFPSQPRVPIDAHATPRTSPPPVAMPFANTSQT